MISTIIRGKVSLLFDGINFLGIIQIKMRDDKGDELCIFQVTDEAYYDVVMDFFYELIRMVRFY